jgi:hypothetical protein
MMLIEREILLPYRSREKISLPYVSVPKRKIPAGASTPKRYFFVLKIKKTFRSGPSTRNLIG